MSRQPASPVTYSRHPHTVYLTEQLWEALDRLYLELRLRMPDPPSKIEFIERVLEAGMAKVVEGDPAPAKAGTAAPATDPMASGGLRSGGEAMSTSSVPPARSTAPARPTSTRRSGGRAAKAPRAATEPAASAGGPKAPKATSRTRPLDRLLQASDPGRPPASHAPPPGSEPLSSQRPSSS